MKIKNLYIKIVSKVDKPTEKKVRESVSKYVEQQLQKDSNFQYDFDELMLEAEQQLTKVSTQLRKINKIPPLDLFVRQNINSVTEMGKPLLLKTSEFKALCKSCGFPEDIKSIEVFLDSNIVFCNILSVDKAELALALSQKKISVAKYDELMQLVDE